MTTAKRKISELELKQLISSRLGHDAFLTVHHHPASLNFTVGIMTTPGLASAMQAKVDGIVGELRAAYELDDSAVPRLASEPGFDARHQTVSFEFWKGSERQDATLKFLQQTDAVSALRFFHTHWAQIGAMAAKTPPTNGVVELVIAG